jgi:hypothetical protein
MRQLGRLAPLTLTKGKTMNISKLLKIAAIGCAGVLLAACEPSEGDISAAVKAQVQAEAAAMQRALGGLGGNMASPEIKSVKKIGCKEDGDNAYKCDVEVAVAINGKEDKKIIPARMVKGSDGWTLAR